MIIINIYVPSYFKKFKCIADRCPDTCCAGWEVNLDSDCVEIYKNIGGKIGDKLKSVLAKDEDGDDIFTLTKCNRCPFLDENNLCELIINIGEDAISKTCTLFPRFYDDFGSFREMGLGFGCPEAARIMLDDNEPFSLVEYAKTDEQAESVDEEFLEFLISLRKDLFLILEDKSLSFKEKISEILHTCKEIQSEIYADECEEAEEICTFDDCIDVLSDMEYIDEKRKNLFLSADKKSFNPDVFETFHSDFEVLMKYYIYRYLLKAVYDDDILTKVKYGVFACAVTGRLYAVEPDRIKVQYGYSKEVEYSDINLEILDNAMYERFTINSLSELF